MQDISTTVTIEIEEYKRLLLDAHDSVRWCMEMHKLRDANEELRTENTALRKELEARSAADT